MPRPVSAMFRRHLREAVTGLLRTGAVSHCCGEGKEALDGSLIDELQRREDARHPRLPKQRRPYRRSAGTGYPSRGSAPGTAAGTDEGL